MRIISQLCTIDLPYDMVAISWHKKEQDYRIIAYPPSDFDADHYFVLAIYLTTGHVHMAMRLMFYAYGLGEKYFQFPDDDAIEKEYEKKFK